MGAGRNPCKRAVSVVGAQDGQEADAGPRPGIVRNILVVDDSRMQRHILRRTLERHGYSVAEAASGSQGLDLCRRHIPDVVISDWVMPGLNGIAFCRALRALGLPHYVYFILLTSKSGKADVAAGLDVGADDFLTKPVNGDELMARIAAGDRILKMERELTEKNRLLTETLEAMQRLHDSINSDLVQARKLQQSLVRDRHRNFGTSQISLLLRPSGHVGGDLVGFFPINSRRVGMFAIDVSGHGITSAMMTARLAGYLSGTSPDQNLALVVNDLGIYDAHPPADFAALLNRVVVDEMQSDSYFTLAYADIDLMTGAASMVQAGHPHPAIVRTGGEVEFVGSGGLPLGLFRDAEFDGFEVRLAPGDRLFLMSDGLIEAQDPAGRQLGGEGLARLLVRRSEQSGQQLLETLVWDLAEYTGDEFADDVSGALFEYFGPKVTDG
ncbi:MAG: PP2C family protein-serine/threonine phosphatase [Pseudomonadota bacterium]